jgi:hypothetical protein
MKIPERHIAALQALGYTEIEARFLYIVATHSGYFAPRQYLSFCGAKWGYRTDHFLEKLECRGHVYWREYQGAGGVYHLFSKPLYAQIGRENLRNRRRHSVEFIKTRLLLLDFILANPQHDYLETEQDKLRYFCEQLQVPKTSLPAKAYAGSSRTEPTLRYFVDKYPLFLDASNASSSPVVTFSYVDPGYAGLAGFANHLSAYQPLFRCLAGFRFVYISHSTTHFLLAEERFSTQIRCPLLADISTEILRYFRLRKAWEMKRYGLFSNDEIEWLNEATRRFHGERFDVLYAEWFSGHVTDKTVLREFAQSSPRKQVQFTTFLVSKSRPSQPVREKGQKRASAPHFRSKDCSLQACTDANCTEQNEIRREEKARMDAAKFG